MAVFVCVCVRLEWLAGNGMVWYGAEFCERWCYSSMGMCTSMHTQKGIEKTMKSNNPSMALAHGPQK